MGHTQSPQPQSPPLIKQFSNFTRTGAGLEKTLRLIQALAQIVADVDVEQATAAEWTLAKTQLALTRRYFRFFNFIECFDKVYGLLGSGTGDTVLTMLELGKWSCLGMYIFMEDLTILHAMNVWIVPWNKPLLTEAYKLWFYAITFSLLGSIWCLFFASVPDTKQKAENCQKKNEKGPKKVSSKTEKSSPSTAPLMRRIIVDGCDLLIPGTFVGWIDVGSVVVGMTMMVSTLVSGRDIWIKAQQS